MNLVAFDGFPFVEGGVTAAKGFSAGGVHCGIRANKSKKDLGVILADAPCAAAAACATAAASAAGGSACRSAA